MCVSRVVLGRPRDDHRHTDRVNDRIADRTQQHASHAAPAVAAHDDKLRGLRLFGQRSTREIKSKESVHLDIGIALSWTCSKVTPVHWAWPSSVAVACSSMSSRS